MSKLRTDVQNRSIHKGCQQLADVLVENNQTLNSVIEKLEIRPTMESIKVLFKAIALAKFEVDSTTKLESNQVTEVWQDLAYAVSQATGVNVEFPSQESMMFNSLEDNM